MKLGVNWSGQREIPVLKEVLSLRNVDFLELLIDNFLTTDIDSIKHFLNGRDCAFHIMNSQFLHRDKVELKEMSIRINKLIDELNPIYISDHIGRFYYKNTALPQMLEIDYSEDLDLVTKKLEDWSKMLDKKLLLENYPSILAQRRTQADFFDEILSKTNCGILFDISNAVISEINTGQKKEDWHGILYDCSNFHIAGFEYGPKNQFLVDTHSQCIDESALNYFNDIIDHCSPSTLSIERDDNFNKNEWITDIDNIRKILNDK
ncbi:DUF692 family multinuclear iron-containing protein [Vibrio cholerae]|nr:DUF692 family protein [Vibrio cholerae]